MPGSLIAPGLVLSRISLCKLTNTLMTSQKFRTMHQRNATLHVGTYALLPSDRFLRILTATPTLSQDGRTLTVEDTQIQVFNELRGKLQDVLKAVKAIVAARKKGRRKSGAAGTNADGMDGE